MASFEYREPLDFLGVALTVALCGPMLYSLYWLYPFRDRLAVRSRQPTLILTIALSTLFLPVGIVVLMRLGVPRSVNASPDSFLNAVSLGCGAGRMAAFKG